MKVLGRMCEGLISNLKKKGNSYPKNKKTLECLFLINNLHYIRKSMEKDIEFENLMKSLYQRILRQIVDYKNKYIRLTWNQLLKEITIKDESKLTKSSKSNTSSKN